MVTNKKGSCDDNGHANLACLLDQLVQIEEQSIDKDEFIKTMARLIRHTHLHFIAEEKLFSTHNYPNTDIHKKEHRELLRYLDRYYLQYQAGKIESITKLKEHLSLWVTNHFLISDKDFHLFLKDKETIPVYG